ncbi:MAG TPA: glycosyltransferase family 1 protein [Candidatus Atribacteria bacterium]|nr:glycosyltransferase family 1 protein [Candidatus Atribacteria bacterium]
MIKIALIRGPYLRPNGVLPWIYLNDNFDDINITFYESKPARFDTRHLKNVKQLLWLDGLFCIFGQKYILSKVLRRLRLPANYLVGIKSVVQRSDIVHVSENYHLFSFQAVRFAKRYKKKICVTAGENIPFPPSQNNPITHYIKRYINRNVDRFTTTAPPGKQALIDEGVPSNKITIVPNTVDTDLFYPAEKNAAACNLPSSFNNTFNILFSHKLVYAKGVPYLLRAFKVFSEFVPCARLILTGINKLDKNSNNLLNVLKSKGIVYHIEHTEYNRMPLLYNLCDVFILPSIKTKNNQEQFGMSILEAMACEKATIVTNVGGMPWVVEKGKTSIVIKERNIGDIVYAFMFLYKNEEKRREMGKAGRARVLSKFTPSVAAKQLQEIYQELIYEKG